MKIQCGRCHNLVESSDRFCQYCGSPLSVPPPAGAQAKSRSGSNLAAILVCCFLGLALLGAAGIFVYAVFFSPAATERTAKEAFSNLRGGGGDEADYKAVITYYLEDGQQAFACDYAEDLLRELPSFENGKWCVELFTDFKRQDLAVRCALLSDHYTGKNALLPTVEATPLSELMEDSPIRQAMELLFVRPAADITLGDLQQVTYLSVGGDEISVGVGEGAGPENCMQIRVDNPVLGGDIGLIYFQGLRRLECGRYPPEDLLLLNLEELYLPHTEEKDFTAFVGMKELKTLVVGGSRLCSLEGIERLPALKTLGIRDSSLTDLSLLATQGAIESLSLEENDGLTSVASLAGMTQLRELSISGESITDLSPVSGLTNLTSISVDGTEIRDASFLSGLKNLRTLVFTDNDSIDALPPLASPAVLETLVIDSDEMLDKTVLQQMVGLRELKLRVTKNLSFLEPLQNLERLTLYSYMSSLDISPLSAHRQLRALSFSSGNSFYDSYTTMLSGLEVLPTLPLEELNLQGKSFYGPLDTVFEVSTLRLLNLNGASSEGTDYSKLANLTNLEVLVMDGYRSMVDVPPGEDERFWSYEAEPASSFADSLGLLTNLRGLSLVGCGLEDVAFAGQLRNLEFLDVGDNAITDISPLKDLENLQYVRLTGNIIRDYAPVEDRDGLSVIR